MYYLNLLEYMNKSPVTKDQTPNELYANQRRLEVKDCLVRPVSKEAFSLHNQIRESLPKRQIQVRNFFYLFLWTSLKHTTVFSSNSKEPVRL